MSSDDKARLDEAIYEPEKALGYLSEEDRDEHDRIQDVDSTIESEDEDEDVQSENDGLGDNDDADTDNENLEDDETDDERLRRLYGHSLTWL